MLKIPLAALRLLYVAIVTCGVTLVIVLYTLARGFSPRFSMPFRRRWARHSMWAMGIRIRRSGTPPDFPCLVLCNHRSHIDPIIIMTEVLGYPVAKAEIESWPVLGYGAKSSGILYLKRESLSSRGHTLAAIQRVLENGFPIILFPEGTTYGTLHAGPFKRGTFQMAAKAGIPIVPVALEYESPAFYWLGNTQFVPHFLRHFGKWHIRVRLAYGPVIRGEHYETLMGETKTWIDQTLEQWRAEATSAPKG